jgi:hypothetical protein
MVLSAIFTGLDILVDYEYRKEMKSRDECKDIDNEKALLVFL